MEDYVITETQTRGVSSSVTVSQCNEGKRIQVTESLVDLCNKQEKVEIKSTQVKCIKLQLSALMYLVKFHCRWFKYAGDEG